MFSLHETTQRRVCRAAFIACAVAPALATVAWAAYALRPWRESDWQRTLVRELHVRASVEYVGNPRPGVTRLEKLRLADLRTSRTLGSIDAIEIRERGTQLALSAGEFQIEMAQVSTLAATFAAWLASDDIPPVELQFERVKLVGPNGKSLTLADTHMQCESGEEQSRRFGIQSGSVRLLVERSGSTSAMLDTGGSSLPVWLLIDLFPSLRRCQDATFIGTMRLESDSESVKGALRGLFEKVALNEWIGPGSSHQFQGVASVEVDQLKWRGNRVELAQGQIRVNGGTVASSLLADLEKRLFCGVDPSASNTEKVRFDELACRFDLSDLGISIAGQCNAAAGVAGCVMAADGRPLLLEPRYAKLPVAQLVQVLAQPAASWLPASREAHEMAGRLPLPGDPIKR